MSGKIIILLTILTLLYATSTSGKPWKKNKCKSNEIWSPCRASCERACGFPDGKRCLTKTAGCICRDGLVRNNNGDCIDPSDCGDERTGPVVFKYGDNN